MSDDMVAARHLFDRAVLRARRHYAPADHRLPETLQQLGIPDADIPAVTDLVLLFAAHVNAPALDDAAMAYCRLRALIGDGGLDGLGGLALGRWLVDTAGQLQVGGRS